MEPRFAADAPIVPITGKPEVTQILEASGFGRPKLCGADAEESITPIATPGWGFGNSGDYFRFARHTSSALFLTLWSGLRRSRLIQLGVFRFCPPQDGDVGVGTHPKREEGFVLAPAVVALS